MALNAKPAEFLRTDDPVVFTATAKDASCASCAYWSRWLPETGDCMLYAYLRREAIIAGATSADVPPKAARATSAGETCSGWSERTGRGLSR